MNFDTLCMPVDIESYNGGPGCSKTGRLFQLLGTDTSNAVLVTNSNENVAAGRKRLEKMQNDTHVTHYNSMMSSPKRCDTLYLDEVHSVHAGEVILIAALSHCASLRLFGDALQTRFHNKIAGFNCFRSNLAELLPATSVLTTSYRCPLDVIHVLRPFYRDYYASINLDAPLMTTTSDVRSSMRWFYIASVVDVPIEEGVIYLVFSHIDGDELQRHGVQIVHTLAAFQGGQGADVIVVRLNANPRSPLYNVQEQVIVALSRHTKSLRYYTRCRDDLLVRLMGVTDGQPTAFNDKDLDTCKAVGFSHDDLYIFTRQPNNMTNVVPTRSGPRYHDAEIRVRFDRPKSGWTYIPCDSNRDLGPAFRTLAEKIAKTP
jgi:hypothetical protein